MSATRMGLLVHPEKGKPASVVADQRDMAAFERAEKIGSPDAMKSMPTVFFRFIAWHAQRRTGAIDVKVSYEDWDAAVVEVEPEDNEVEADPGQPEASAATS